MHKPRIVIEERRRSTPATCIGGISGYRKPYAKNHAVPLVRQQCRRGSEFLRLGIQGFKERKDRSLRRRWPWARRVGDDRKLPTRRTGIRSSEWRTDIQIHGSSVFCGELRWPGRGGLLLGKTLRRRKQESMRVAEGQVRPLLAGGADSLAFILQQR